MELAAAARVLWRHRLIALLGLPLVIAIAVICAHRLSPPERVYGVASAKILVDTPKSQLVDLAPSVGLDPTVADGLPVRVDILADELAGDASVDALARQAGLPKDRIAVLTFGVGPTRTTPLARRLAELNPGGHRPYVVQITADGREPIVNILTSAPTGVEAKRLADAAVATFSSVVRSDGPHRGFVAKPLGPSKAGQFLQGSGMALTAAVALSAVVMWLFGIVMASGTASAWIQRRPVRLVEA